MSKWKLPKIELPKRNINVLIHGVNGGLYVGQYMGGKVEDEYAYFHIWQNDRYKPIKCIAWLEIPKLDI